MVVMLVSEGGACYLNRQLLHHADHSEVFQAQPTSHNKPYPARHGTRDSEAVRPQDAGVRQSLLFHKEGLGFLNINPAGGNLR